MGGASQPRLLCIVMAASELVGARVFVRQGPFAAWRRADACVGVWVCVCVELFFSLCLFCLCVSLASLFLLLFFSAASVFL